MFRSLVSDLCRLGCFIVLAIRASIFRVFEFCQSGLVGDLEGWDKPEQIIVKRYFKKQDEFDDFCLRITHFLPNDLDISVVVCVSRRIENKCKLSNLKIVFRLRNIKTAHKKCWFLYPRVGLSFFYLVSYFINIRKSIIVDPLFYYYSEIENWIKLSYVLSDQSVITEVSKISESNICKLKKRVNTNTIGVCALTGPSVKNLGVTFELPKDSLVITCNTMLNDFSVLEKLRPDVYAIVDLVFMGSPEEYNKDFFKNLRRLKDIFNPYILISEKFAPLFVRLFPELKWNIICSSFKSSAVWDITLNSMLNVKGLGSTVLVNAMLPLLSELMSEVLIIGADGYTPDQKRVQIAEHVDQIKYLKAQGDLIALHPSCMRDCRLRKTSLSYYQSLESLILHLEDKGVSVSTLTKSYVPCLADRYRLPNALSSESR